MLQDKYIFWVSDFICLHLFLVPYLSLYETFMTTCRQWPETQREEKEHSSVNNKSAIYARLRNSAPRPQTAEEAGFRHSWHWWVIERRFKHPCVLLLVELTSLPLLIKSKNLLLRKKKEGSGKGPMGIFFVFFSLQSGSPALAESLEVRPCV